MLCSYGRGQAVQRRAGGGGVWARGDIPEIIDGPKVAADKGEQGSQV